MSFLDIFLIALGLSMDCFAVSIGFGVQKKLRWKDIFRFALFFALFQAFMPVVGWLVGTAVTHYLSKIQYWIAFAILTFIGLKMIIESFKAEHERRTVDIRDWRVLISISLATSIDALMTGVGFGFIKVNIFLAVLLIGLVTFLNSLAGAWVGLKSIHVSGRWAEIIGGMVLIGIGIKFVLEHMSF